MALSVSVVALNVEWEHIFRNVSRTTCIGTIKQLVEVSVKAAAIGESDLTASVSVSLLYNGTVIPYDDIPLQNIVPAGVPEIKLHALVLDDSAPVSTLSMQVPITHMMDPVSFAAAQAWIGTVSDASPDSESYVGSSSTRSPAAEKVKALRRVLTAFEHQELSAEHGRSVNNNVVPEPAAIAAVDAANAAAMNVAQQANNQRDELFRNLPPVQWVQWPLVVKLIVTSILFSYNRHMAVDRMLGVAGVALLTYFVQIGAFVYWFRLVCIYMVRGENYYVAVRLWK